MTAGAALLLTVIAFLLGAGIGAAVAVSVHRAFYPDCPGVRRPSGEG